MGREPIGWQANLTVRGEVHVIFRVRVATEIAQPYVVASLGQCERQVPVVGIVNAASNGVHQPGIRTVHETMLQQDGWLVGCVVEWMHDSVHLENVAVLRDYVVNFGLRRSKERRSFNRSVRK